jgi:hypothetical protein
MNDSAGQIRDLSMSGYCCSQIMVKMGLDFMGKENPDLLNAVAGLCRGVHAGLICGTLTGGACLLSLYDKNEAAASMIPQLVAWFEETYGSLYGGTSCLAIIEGDPVKKYERCPGLMVETFEKCRELLEEAGYES